MSAERQRYPRAVALKIAEELEFQLAPLCRACRIVGSLRREKPDVGDIELLYIPIWRKVRSPVDMFAQVPCSEAEDLIAAWLKLGTLKQRPNKLGNFTWGPQNKLAIHAASGIPVDLFATTEENWWVSLVIRTGGKETNLRLTTGAHACGRKLHAYGSGFTDRDGGRLLCKSEEEVFGFAGLPYLPPEKRA